VTPSQVAALGRVLDADLRIAYGVVFGSTGRGEARTGSDLDVAIGLATGVEFDALAIGRLVSDLERVSGRTVGVVLLHDAPPALAYRVFRDGVVVFVRDRPAMVERRVKAILDYLDYRPFESAFVRGVLRARG
jgi:predicted nucleotidyltransferase